MTDRVRNISEELMEKNKNGSQMNFGEQTSNKETKALSPELTELLFFALLFFVILFSGKSESKPKTRSVSKAYKYSFEAILIFILITTLILLFELWKLTQSKCKCSKCTDKNLKPRKSESNNIKPRKPRKLKYKDLELKCSKKLFLN